MGIKSLTKTIKTVSLQRRIRITPYSTFCVTWIKSLFDSIKKVNLTLWDIEDKIRICEKNKDFGNEFIKLARGVYHNNDKRAKIKSAINKALGSNITEIKQYVDY